ncbi:hypothetical protein ROTAS13_04388 [Roseomonas sp. TAS13]|nr:hypothetical protein ROTAS13_04388 [Roseomonas sp. TAS13]
MRIMLSAGSCGPKPSSRPPASRRTVITGCSSRRTVRPDRVSAAMALSTRKGMSSVTISSSAPPRPGPGGCSRSFASAGRRSEARDQSEIAAAASASGDSAASSAVGRASKRWRSSTGRSSGRAGASRRAASPAAPRISSRSRSGPVPAPVCRPASCSTPRPAGLASCGMVLVLVLCPASGLLAAVRLHRAVPGVPVGIGALSGGRKARTRDASARRSPPLRWPRSTGSRTPFRCNRATDAGDARRTG